MSFAFYFLLTGHMKIEEPKTPFNYYEDGEDGETGAGGPERRDGTFVDPVDLSNRYIYIKFEKLYIIRFLNYFSF